MAATRTPASFTVGWVCALPVELAAAGAMMDEEYEDLPQPPADTNIYSYGRVGVHNVVAACLPAGRMGNNPAAVVASQMRSSFPSLRFGVLVGIGRGVPSDEHDIRLGDVVISQPTGLHGGVVQFDFGKTGLDGRITRTGSLNAPPTILLNALAKLRANDLRGKTHVGNHLSAFSTLQEFACPGWEQDTLYAASSQHVLGPTCAQCSQDDIVPRHARATPDPVLFFGTIASGNQVMKDAPTRDRISQDLGGILCFEMEAAGLMNNFPCLVVRGICNYADAHKNKQWQPYAAATAAACTKELLRIIPQVVSTGDNQKEDLAPEIHFMVPFGRNSNFVGRETVLERIALEAAYRINEKHPECSVFWVPAVDRNIFENAYRDFGLALRLPGIDDDKADVKNLAKTALSKGAINTKWLLIIDNAHETDLFLGVPDAPGLCDYLPFHRNGSVLFITRNHEVVIKLDVLVYQIPRVTEMSETEAGLMLQKTLWVDQQEDKQRTKELLKHLACLPLAIKQASAFMAERGTSTTKYLELCHESDESQVELLSINFEDRGRYPEIANPIATTWLITFHHIARRYPLAVYYLKFVYFMAQKDIPKSLFPHGRSKIEEKRAFGVLHGYAFVSLRDDAESFDVHRLVRLATMNWFKEERTYIITGVVRHLAVVYLSRRHEN
ncbi:nucleoside phosphorylase domain-containing protein [Truncatella angustata]|uniref:Nucleoside phosphorylase domain-containing protein n=1 Tax=Truncatella angustata TaxID=152316 RepID=A0A9P8RM68_9PEZI|nr:nucleoside phosphorylase domain-containing protein [Truncatella angustata]KAH6646798.1 nucleoside phosphorylase domain-containing protein [Truncatella angustata]